MVPQGMRSALQAIRTADVADGAASGRRAIAAFDLDGTMYDGEMLIEFVEQLAHLRPLGRTAGIGFGRALHRAGIAGADVLGASGTAQALAAVRAVRTGELGGVEFFEATARALRGRSMSSLNRLGERFIHHGLGGRPAWITHMHAGNGATMADVVTASSRAGLEPVAVTLAFDWLARPAAAAAGIQPANVFASRSVARNGRFTGQVLVERNKSLTCLQTIGSAPTIAFGDSASDLSMLSVATHRAFMVNPKHDLLAGVRELNNPRISLLRVGTAPRLTA